MASLIVERARLLEMVKEWLSVLGTDEGEQFQVTFSPDQVTIRPQTDQQAELDKWLEQATAKYDSVLRRLADS